MIISDKERTATFLSNGNRFETNEDEVKSKQKIKVNDLKVQ